MINTASASGSWTNVNATTFAITGVTLQDLASYQYALETGSTPLPRTLSQIQAIVDETNQAIMLAAIYDYLNPFGGGSTPNEEVFAQAGITGVTASNLGEVLSALESAYQEAKN